MLSHTTAAAVRCGHHARPPLTVCGPHVRAKHKVVGVGNCRLRRLARRAVAAVRDCRVGGQRLVRILVPLVEARAALCCADGLEGVGGVDCVCVIYVWVREPLDVHDSDAAIGLRLDGSPKAGKGRGRCDCGEAVPRIAAKKVAPPRTSSSSRCASRRART